jgi:hypothetical protein
VDVFYSATSSVEDILNLVNALDEKFNLEKIEIEKLKTDIKNWCRKVKCSKYKIDIGEGAVTIRGMIYNGSDVPILVRSIVYPIFENSSGQYEILFNLAEETEYRNKKVLES